MQVNQIVTEIDAEIERLQQARNLLAGTNGVKAGRHSISAAPKATKGTRKRKLSAEGRRKISEAQKARWAQRRKRQSTRNSG
jgi:hypothetical protein